MKRLLLLMATVLPGCGGGGGTGAAPAPVPQISLSSGSLAFTCSEGGADPPSQTVTLSNTGEAGSVLNWTATSSEPWLTVSPSSASQGTTGSTLLTISVDATTQIEGWTGSTSTLGAPATGWGAWTGSAMLIWTGDPSTPGKYYDPVADTWFGSTSTVGAPSTRTLFSAVWTGTEMIVWGGVTSWGGTPLDTGARYNPSTDTWTPMSTTGAPSPRFAHRAVWTGTQMIVWGGDSGGYSYKDTGGIYDPATDTWVGATTTTGAPAARAYHAAVWTGTRMLIWGGENPGKFDTGAFYDPVLDAWTGTTSTTNAPSARSHMEGVWTGREMVIWGGGSGGPHLNTGGRYNPATDTWTGATPTAGAPNGRASHVAVWTGSQMIVWGGEENGTLVNTGGLYRPPIPPEGPHTGTITIAAPGASNSPQMIAVSLTVSP